MAGDVRKLKDEADHALNVAIAKLVGYTVRNSIERYNSSCEDLYYKLVHRGVDVLSPTKDNWFNGERDTEEDAWEDVPEYCTDPAAAKELQEIAIDADKLKYLNALLSLVWPDGDIQFGLGGSMEVVGYNIDATASMLLATPRQISEAAYVTLKLEAFSSGVKQ